MCTYIVSSRWYIRKYNGCSCLIFLYPFTIIFRFFAILIFTSFCTKNNIYTSRLFIFGKFYNNLMFAYSHI